MSLYQQNQTSPEKEKEGVPLHYGLNSRGEEIIFQIAREGGRNSVYNKLAEVTFKPVRRQIQHGTIDPVQLDKMLAEVYSKAVVKGWVGVEDENNNPLEFNEANCRKILTDLPVVFDAIKECARDFSQYLMEQLDEDVKN